MRRSDFTLHHLRTRLTAAALANNAGLFGAVGRPQRARHLRQADDDLALATVTTVDDPDGSMRLIGVTGIAEATTIATIDGAIFDDPVTNVHVDLSGTVAWMPGALGRLEQVLDEAELLGFRLRVIGLDPQALQLPDQLSI